MQWMSKQALQLPAYILAGIVTLLAILVTYPSQVQNRIDAKQDELASKFNTVFIELEHTFSSLEGFFRRQDKLSLNCDTDVLHTLRSAHFAVPFVAEFGLVSNIGQLHCTSWGKITPSLSVQKPPAQYNLRFHGPELVSFMQEFALIVAKTRSDGSEINALVPQPVMNLILSSIGHESGYIAIVDSEVGVPLFLDGKYSLPIGQKSIFPLKEQRQFFRAKFDDLNHKLLIVERFPSLNGLALALAIDTKTVDLGLYWPSSAQLITYGMLFVGLFYLIASYQKRYLSLHGWIKSGIERDQFINHYQPVVDSASGKVTGVETLVRWQHPVDGMIPPYVFIPEAESSGLIVPMTYNIVRNAVQDLAFILKRNPDFKVNININGLHLKDTAFIDFVLQSQAKIPRLTIELTETELIEFDDPAVNDNLKRLRDQGITMAVDDFGTGYAGLQYLQQLPLDILKIDQSFVSAIDTDSPRSKVLEAIISLSHKLNLVIIAEGVETEAQAQYLKENQVFMHQGWFYAKAMSAEQLMAFDLEQFATTASNTAS